MDKGYLLYDFEGSGGLYWDNEIRCVTLVASKGTAGEEFRYRLDMLLKHVIEKKCDKILAELDSLAKVEPEDLLWTEKQWLPRAAAAGVKAIAVVLPQSLSGHLALDQLTASADEDNLGYVRGFFSNTNSAKEWLKSQ